MDHKKYGEIIKKKFIEDNGCVDCGSKENTKARSYDYPWIEPSVKRWGSTKLTVMTEKVEVICYVCERKELDHYENTYKTSVGVGKPCSFRRCDRETAGKGFCHKHRYHVVTKFGLDIVVRKIAPKGSGHINEDGYRVLWDIPRQRMIGEHRLVMEKSLGRYLTKEETVHHKNGDRLCNDISNLELWSSSHPAGQRVVDKLEWAKHIIEKYGDYDDTHK